MLPKAPNQEKTKDAVAQSDKNSALNLSNAFEGLDGEDPPSDLEEMVAEPERFVKSLRRLLRKRVLMSWQRRLWIRSSP